MNPFYKFLIMVGCAAILFCWLVTLSDKNWAKTNILTDGIIFSIGVIIASVLLGIFSEK